MDIIISTICINQQQIKMISTRIEVTDGQNMPVKANKFSIQINKLLFFNKDLVTRIHLPKMGYKKRGTISIEMKNSESPFLEQQLVNEVNKKWYQRKNTYEIVIHSHKNYGGTSKIYVLKGAKIKSVVLPSFYYASDSSTKINLKFSYKEMAVLDAEDL